MHTPDADALDGLPDDSVVGMAAAMTFVGCSRWALDYAYRQGKLDRESIPGALGHPGFRVGALRKFKAERAGAPTDGKDRLIDLKRAAEISGVPYCTLLKQANKLDRENKNPDARKAYQGYSFLAALGIVPVKHAAVGRGKPRWKILETEAQRLHWAVARDLERKPPRGFEDFGAPGKRLGLRGRPALKELHQCLHCWRENGQLPAEQLFRKCDGKATVGRRTSDGKIAADRRTIAVKRLRLKWYFDADRAVRLWTNECTPSAGAARLRQLVADDQRLAREELKEEMRRAGFVGIRYGKAYRLSGLARRWSNGRASPRLYELPCGQPRKPVIKVLEEIMAQGPPLAHVAEKRLSAAGWSPKSKAVERAMTRLKIKVRTAGGRQPPDGPRLFCGPYAAPPCTVGDQLVYEGSGPVEVGGMHDGLIPWPYARRPGRGGLRRLILCGDLVKAVRNESATAVAHWWGVSVTIVTRWRRALGVPAPGFHYWCLPGQEPPDAAGVGQATPPPVAAENGVTDPDGPTAAQADPTKKTRKRRGDRATERRLTPRPTDASPRRGLLGITGARRTWPASSTCR